MPVTNRPRVGAPAPEIDDRSLAIAFKRGDQGAYPAIYARYNPLVLAICRRRLPPDDAEEAAQDVFLRVYTSLPSFNGDYRLGPWIARIATNVCHDSMRARRRRPSDPTSGEEFALIADPHEAIPEEISLRAVDSRRVRHHISALPKWYRAALYLREYEGRSYQDIAQQLQLSQSQTKALLHRARQGFKRRWLKALEVEADVS